MTEKLLANNPEILFRKMIQQKNSFIFTVTAGRSGQASLANLFRKHVFNCYPAFEEPQIHYYFPVFLNNIERRFRRRFIETHELLGRGKILTAFELGNDLYLKNIAECRIRKATRTLIKEDLSIYVDISKYFARGLHRGFAQLLPSFSLIRLVRDPLLNMKSFLNRKKDFLLDNSSPDRASNILRIDSSNFSSGEFYLWAWCEMYLRFDKIIQDYNVKKFVEIRTENLANPEYIESAFNTLELPYSPVQSTPPLNTNVAQGLEKTLVTKEDIIIFNNFLNRLPSETMDQIIYFSDYQPELIHNL